MMNYLKDWNCIDYEGLLLLKCKDIHISSEECCVLLYIIRFGKMDVVVTPMLLMEYLSFDSKIIDQCLHNLMKLEYIVNVNGCIEIGCLYERLLLNQESVDKPKSINLIKQFEEEFGKPLTPMELSMLREWKESNKYDDDIILKALKEAVKSNVLRFRYIDGILENWKKTGVKQRFAEETEDPSSSISSEFEWWK